MVIIPQEDKNENIYFLHAMGQYGLWVPEKLKEMSENAKKIAISDGTKRICDMVAELSKK